MFCPPLLQGGNDGGEYQQITDFLKETEEYLHKLAAKVALVRDQEAWQGTATRACHASSLFCMA